MCEILRDLKKYLSANEKAVNFYDFFVQGAAVPSVQCVGGYGGAMASMRKSNFEPSQSSIEDLVRVSFVTDQGDGNFLVESRSEWRERNGIDQLPYLPPVSPAHVERYRWWEHIHDDEMPDEAVGNFDLNSTSAEDEDASAFASVHKDEKAKQAAEAAARRLAKSRMRKVPGR